MRTAEALQWLDETSPEGRQQAAQLHCNRALCLLSIAGVLDDGTAPSSHAHAAALDLALQEATAAVEADPTSHKVGLVDHVTGSRQRLIPPEGSSSAPSMSHPQALYRRASACLARGEWDAAAADARACLALLSAPGASCPPMLAAMTPAAVAAERREASKLLARAQHGREQQHAQTPAPPASSDGRHAATAAPGDFADADAYVQACSGGMVRVAPFVPPDGSAHAQPGSPAGDGSSSTEPDAARQQQPGGGRCLRLARAVRSAGADVLRERPLAAVLAKGEARRQRCWNCTRRLPDVAGVRVPLFCRRCPMVSGRAHDGVHRGGCASPSAGGGSLHTRTPAPPPPRLCTLQVHYCSAGCREQDLFHAPAGAECGVAWARVLPEHALLASRLARLTCNETAGAAARGASVVGQPGPPRRAEARVQLARALVHHAGEPREAEAALERCLLAVLAARAVARCGGARRGQSGGGGDLGPTAVEVLLCALRVDLNGVALKPAASDGARWGLAVYGAASAMNHACRPNVTLRCAADRAELVACGRRSLSACRQELGSCRLLWTPSSAPSSLTALVSACRFVRGDTLVARLTQPATAAGAELTICYGPAEGERPAGERRAALRSHYLFACACRACARPSEQERRWAAHRFALACPSGGTAAPGACPGGWVPGTASPLWRCWLGEPAGAGDAGRETGACDVCGAAVAADAARQAERALLRVAELCDEASAACERAERMGEAGEAAEALRRALGQFLEAHEAYRRHAHAGHVWVGRLADLGARAAARLLRLGGAAAERGRLARLLVELRERALLCAQARFPPGSVQLATEQLQLADALQLAHSGDDVAAAASSASRCAWLRQAAGLVLWEHFGGGADDGEGEGV